MSIALETGAMLGRYELLTQIGRGGMASVWVARERSPTGRARLVAVKVLLPSLARRADFRTMFLDEGQIIRSIDHDNVVGVYEVAEDHGLLFMAMEWVEGDSLRNVIKEAQRRRPIPPEMAVRIIADTAAGLHAAHELRGWDGALRNLVHCDVSPHNILIGLSGMTKLTDFGVASAEEHFGELSSERRVKGKVGYMSPEQAGGQPIDRRTDVYALGIVLYELTTGERLFKGMNHDHSLALVMNARVPRPSSVLADYPAPLEAIVLRALEREPSARFQTAEEMQQALERYLVAERILVPRSGVAQLLKRVVGGRIEERRQAIRAALAQVDGQTPLGLVPDTAVALRDSLVSVTEPSSPSALAHLTPSVPRPSFTGTGESLLTSSQASTTAAASLPLERAASRRSPWRFGLGVGLGVAAGVAAVLALRGSSARGPVAVPIAGVESSARVQASQPTARPRDEGVDIGSLPIAGHDAGRTYDEAEREQLERAWKQRKRDAGVRVELEETPEPPAKPGAPVEPADVHLDDAPTPAPTAPAPPAPAPTAPAPTAAPSGPLNQGAAIAALGRAAGGASGCRQPGGPSGAGRASVTIAPSGRVSSVSVSSPFAGTAVGACVASRYRGVSVPPFTGSSVTLGSGFVVPE